MHKVNKFSVSLLLVVAIIIHITFLKYIAIWGARPDVLLILVAFFGLFLGPRYGLWTGTLAGLSKDIFSFDPFGVNTFTLGLTGIFIGLISTKFFRESKFTQLLLVFSFSVFSMMAHFILISFVSAHIDLKMSECLTSSILPSSLYTAIISIPIFSRLIVRYGFKTDSELL